MTCAACANRIERKLNKLEGVDASVNYATEQAAVRFDPDRVTVADLLGAVESAGYHAVPAAEARESVDRSDAVRRRLLVAAVLTAPLVVLAMVMPLQFEGWEWLALALATPVVFWSGFDFHRAAVLNARPRRRNDGHAHLDRHARGLGLVGRRTRRRRRRGRLLRGRRRDHDADPARALPRISGATSLECRDPLAPRARREGCSRAPRRDRGLGSDRRARCRRSLRRSSGREGGDGRSGRRGRVRGRPVDAHGRAGAGRRRAWCFRRRGDGQHVRAARRACDEGR